MPHQIHSQTTPYSALHQALGLTDSDIRRELAARGLDPDAEAQALRLMIRLGVAHTRRALSAHRDLASGLLARLAEMAPAAMAEAEREIELEVEQGLRI
ncbi:hypothetical protein [Pseudoduganella aquatica]|uniref:Uncharacterized protein n=1 Tax=Pseudoduganella aquatica TaxID=2660641 RepID=A0A7X4HH91_9BURK|nr:hypothetical protein [Pseudoduganella aquatica]MYN11241.1 hypothetical protein [Pseudoduganella aquatica]